MATVRLTLRSLRAHRSRYILGTTAVVVSVAFLVGGSLLIQALSEQLRVAGADDVGSSAGLFLLLSAFGLIVVVAAGFVIANSFQTMVVARGRELALLRSVGMRRRQTFGAVLLEAALIGLIGAAAGLLVGTVAAWGLTTATMPDAGLPLPGIGTLLLAALVGLGVTTGSVLLPARAATAVAPVAALTGTETAAGQPLPRLRVAAGAALLALGLGLVALPAQSADAVLAFTAGALLSFTALSLLAPAAMPPVSRLVARAARSAPVRLAAGQVDRSRRRVANTTMAVVLGSTLFTGAVVVLNSLVVGARDAGYSTGDVGGMFALALGLTGFTVLVGLIGVINTLALSTRERTRELSLLRAVGMTASEVRRTIVVEGLIVALLGMAAGVLFGTAGASLLLFRLRDATWTVAPPWLLLSVAVAVIIVVITAAARLLAGRAAAAAPALATTTA